MSRIIKKTLTDLKKKQRIKKFLKLDKKCWKFFKVRVQIKRNIKIHEKVKRKVKVGRIMKKYDKGKNEEIWQRGKKWRNIGKLK